MTNLEPNKINLKQFAKHKKHFPWRLLVKLALGLGLIYFTYLLTDMVLKRNLAEDKSQDEIEVEISYE